MNWHDGDCDWLFVVGLVMASMLWVWDCWYDEVWSVGCCGINDGLAHVE